MEMIQSPQSPFSPLNPYPPVCDRKNIPPSRYLLDVKTELWQSLSQTLHLWSSKPNKLSSHAIEHRILQLFGEAARIKILKKEDLKDIHKIAGQIGLSIDDQTSEKDHIELAGLIHMIGRKQRRNSLEYLEFAHHYYQAHKDKITKLIVPKSHSPRKTSAPLPKPFKKITQPISFSHVSNLATHHSRFKTSTHLALAALAGLSSLIGLAYTLYFDESQAPTLNIPVDNPLTSSLPEVLPIVNTVANLFNQTIAPNTTVPSTHTFQHIPAFNLYYPSPIKIAVAACISLFTLYAVKEQCSKGSNHLEIPQHLPEKKQTEHSELIGSILTHEVNEEIPIEQHPEVNDKYVENQEEEKLDFQEITAYHDTYEQQSEKEDVQIKTPKRRRYLNIPVTPPELFDLAPSIEGLKIPSPPRRHKVVKFNSHVEDSDTLSTTSDAMSTSSNDNVIYFPSPKSKLSLPPKIKTVNARVHNRREIAAELIAAKLEHGFQQANALDYFSGKNEKWIASKSTKKPAGMSSQSLCGNKAGITTIKGKKEPLHPTHFGSLIALTENHKQTEIPIFGLFDSIHGEDASLYLEKNLPGQLYGDFSYALKSPDREAAIFNRLKKVFVNINDSYLNSKEGSTDPSSQASSTGAIALLIHDHLWVASLGQRVRAFLFDPEADKPIALTNNTLKQIKVNRGVEKRGGFVRPDGTIEKDNIAIDMPLGRGFGYDEEKTAIHARSKIVNYPIDLTQNKLAYLIIASGLWDVASLDQINEKIRKYKNQSCETISKKLAIKTHHIDGDKTLSVLVVDLGKLIKTLNV